MRILVVEDSSRLREGLAKALTRAGYAVDTAADGKAGLWEAGSTDYDAIVLDIMLPEMDGLDVLRHLRREGSAVPVLLLTARDTVPDRVEGLREGADDYLVKPFALDELLARIEALCRRAYRSTSNTILIAGLEIDLTRRRAAFEGHEILLRAREFALLEYLARRIGEVVSRSDIEAHVYDAQADPMSNVVDATIYRLRRQLTDGGVPPLIHTRRGLGYVFETREK